jgi:hypothetical protein
LQTLARPLRGVEQVLLEQVQNQVPAGGSLQLHLAEAGREKVLLEVDLRAQCPKELHRCQDRDVRLRLEAVDADLDDLSSAEVVNHDQARSASAASVSEPETLPFLGIDGDPGWILQVVCQELQRGQTADGFRGAAVDHHLAHGFVR